MTTDDRKPTRRRYLVQLARVRGSKRGQFDYLARISPWPLRRAAPDEIRERRFTDERDLIAAINPLLPRDSDVRDVFTHIENPNGFYYLLHLSREEVDELAADAQA